MKELVFEVIQESDGGWVAECLGESIVTEGDTFEVLRACVEEAVRGFYFDRLDSLPPHIHLRSITAGITERIDLSSSRLAREAGRLSTVEEQAIADEALRTEDKEWPSY